MQTLGRTYLLPCVFAVPFSAFACRRSDPGGTSITDAMRPGLLTASPLMVVARRAIVCSRLLRRPFPLASRVSQNWSLDNRSNSSLHHVHTVCACACVRVVWTGKQSTASEPGEQDKVFSGVSYGASLSQPGLHAHDAPKSSRIKRVLLKR